jgi:nicotinate-nucleotide--dimethylbenzimidazole phosphoribosyltransferase
MLVSHSIAPVDAQAARAARDRIDNLAKPLRSLGRIEDLAQRLAAIAGMGVPLCNYKRRVILIGAGDHGIRQEGVSAYPSEVTPQMVGAFLAEMAAINAFSRAVDAEVYVANFGVAAALPKHERLFNVCIANGTKNFLREPAMTHAHAQAAIEAGAFVFTELRERVGVEVLALGEMGIGNTTSAAALICALTGADAEEIVGRGTGIDDATYERKIAAVRVGAKRCESRDWLDCASEVGGFEILGLAGAMLAAASARIPVVLDGFIVSAAALIAARIEPNVAGYLIAAHRSQEKGHAFALAQLGLQPLLDLELRLGEARGAALALPLVEAAARMFREMKTFAEAGVATASATESHT